MGSLFEKAPTAKPVHGAFARERIVTEVKHVTDAASQNRQPVWVRYGRFAGGIVLLILMALYFLDPFVFAARKTQAIRAYLYERQHGDPKIASALLLSGYFDEIERANLQNRTGNFQSFFSSQEDCRRVGKETLRYWNMLVGMHNGNLGNVDGFNRFRYYLFASHGILPPMPVEWSTMTPYFDRQYTP